MPDSLGRGSGLLAMVGIEWMPVGEGVWHGGGAGGVGCTLGYNCGVQLWVALPPHLELGWSGGVDQRVEMERWAGPAYRLSLV
jgi:hypothetical protein